MSWVVFNGPVQEVKALPLKIDRFCERPRQRLAHWAQRNSFRTPPTGSAVVKPPLRGTTVEACFWPPCWTRSHRAVNELAVWSPSRIPEPQLRRSGFQEPTVTPHKRPHPAIYRLAQIHAGQVTAWKEGFPQDVACCVLAWILPSVTTYWSENAFIFFHLSIKGWRGGFYATKRERIWITSCDTTTSFKLTNMQCDQYAQ